MGAALSGHLGKEAIMNVSIHRTERCSGGFPGAKVLTLLSILG